MSAISLLAFALVAFVSIVTPGPDTLLSLSNGSRFGVLRAAPGMIGVIVGDLLLIGAAAVGFGELLAASEFWFAVVKWLGVAYLAFLGIRLLSSEGIPHPLPERSIDKKTGEVAPLFLRSLIVSLSNPKNYLFFAALLPQFVASDTPHYIQYIELSVVVVLIDVCVMTGYATLGARSVQLLRISGVRWLDRICGCIFILLSASLAIYRGSR